MQLQIWYLSINSTVKKSAFSLKKVEFNIISVIRYYYTRKNHSEPKLTSESNWRWETNCKELVLKLQSNNIRTKAFTQQLIVLAKQFGTLTHKNYTNHAKDYIKQGF